MYPSRSQYKTAVKNRLFPAKENGGYDFIPIKHNDDIVLSAGGNATVFKVQDVGHNIYAVKLFTDFVEDRFERLKKISNYLQNIALPFFVNFEFVDKLIYVDMPNQSEEECYFPGVVMQWIEAPTLETKLKELVEKKDIKAIRIITEKFKRLSIDLLKSNIGHGDLKLSNILVNDNLELFLIDYDGMFIPEFSGQQSIELGTPGYQHIARNKSHYNEKIDHFSILTILTSFIAISINPDFYLRYNNGDNTIFKTDDFFNPNNSKLFHELSQIKETSILSFLLKQSLNNGSIYIDNLLDILDAKYPKPELIITHSPKEPFVDELVKISWSTKNTDYISIDGTDKTIHGFYELQMPRNLNLDIVYGNDFEKQRLNYKAKGIPKPEILEFSIDKQIIKYDPDNNFGETIVVKTKAINFTKAELILNEDIKDIIDVSRQYKTSIAGVIKDTNVKFRLYSKRDGYTVEKSLLVEVYNPVKLTVKQNKKIIFPGRPVTISIESEKANKVTLQPFNIDLTGKKEYDLLVDRDATCTIIAENKKYSESRSFRVEVIKLVEYPRQIIRLSDIQFKVPMPNFLRFNKKEELLKLEREDLFARKFNMIMDKLNMFKVISKVKYK